MAAVVQPVVQPEVVPYDGVPPNVCDFCLQTFTSPVGVKKHKTKVRCTKNVPCTQIFIEKFNLGELDLTKSAEQYREHLAKKHAKDNGDLLQPDEPLPNIETKHEIGVDSEISVESQTDVSELENTVNEIIDKSINKRIMMRLGNLEENRILHQQLLEYSTCIKRLRMYQRELHREHEEFKKREAIYHANYEKNTKLIEGILFDMEYNL